MNRLISGCVAEFLGTFALVFFGAGAIILGVPALGGASSLVTVALAHGMILFVFVAACGYISGGQFNPAVSIALVVAGKQPLARAGAFIAVQLLAAACAAGMLQALLGPSIANAPAAKLGATIGKFTVAGFTGQVIGIEAVLTFALMFVFLATAVDERGARSGFGPLAIGMTVAACILAAGPITGASMNPARTFGPAICGNQWAMFHAYLIGPLVGAVAAAIVYRLFWEPRGMDR